MSRVFSSKRETNWPWRHGSQHENMKYTKPLMIPRSKCKKMKIEILYKKKPKRFSYREPFNLSCTLISFKTPGKLEHYEACTASLTQYLSPLRSGV